ncbi:hypothetical protein ABZ832_30665, partial [Streptantibioticus parmotrematis]|uniref:hypothetical protein n=1 Tax=Streptantibioticus parmotrematis TaxID=2873249 RepID=UPI0033F393D3
DLLAILIIAVFYTSTIHFPALGLAVAVDRAAPPRLYDVPSPTPLVRRVVDRGARAGLRP